MGFLAVSKVLETTRIRFIPMKLSSSSLLPVSYKDSLLADVAFHLMYMKLLIKSHCEPCSI